MSGDIGNDLWRQPVGWLQNVPQRGQKPQDTVCSGFKDFDLKDLPLGSAAMFDGMIRIDRGIVTSDSNEAAEVTGGR